MQLLSCLLLALLALTHHHPTACAGPIVINEVLSKPANDSTTLAKTSDWGVITGSVEWIELVNRGSTEVRPQDRLWWRHRG